MLVLTASMRVTVLIALLGLVLLSGVATPSAASAQEGDPSVPANSACAPTSPATVETVDLAAVGRAFDLLMDRFVRPLPSSAMLEGAWKAAVAEVEGRLGQASGHFPTPLFNGDRDHDWRLFSDEFGVLAASCAYLIAPVELGRAAIAGMAAAVDEGHTRYMSPGQFREYLDWSRGVVQYEGIGARLAGPMLAVIEVFEGSPAQAAGLRPGDVLTEVDGRSVEGWSVEDVIRLVRGREGTTVHLTLRRPGMPVPLNLAIPRSRIQLPFVRWSLVDGEIGYVALRGFAAPSVATEVEQALANLESRGARGLVLDLRGNSGGRLDVGVRLLSRFISEGVLFRQVGRSGLVRSTTPIAAYAGPSLPVVVLVDGGTASMAEIFASAIREHGVGWVVGQPTAGSVAAAEVYPLGDGSALQVTVTEIYSGQGKLLNGAGVQPDLEVAPSLDDLAQGVDRQLVAGVRFLREKLLEHGRVEPAASALRSAA